MLVRSDFTRAFCEELLDEYKTKINAARALHGRAFTRFGTVMSVRTIETIIIEVMKSGIVGRQDYDRISTLEKLFHQHNIPLAEVNRVQSVKIGSYGVQAKDADGNIVTTALDKTQVTLIPNTPDFPVIDKAAAGPVVTSEFPRIMRSTRQIFVYSDAQIGYLQDPETHALEPIHDPAALDVAHQIMMSVRPDEVDIIGDWMDLSFASRWTQHAEFDAPNQCIQTAYDELRRIKADAGPQLRKFVFVEGNHDQRLERMLLEHNKTALRIRRAADTTGWPVFSMPYLLRFDELGISTTGRYPGGDYYLLPDLMLTHAPPRVAEINASVIHGHTHKLSVTPRVAHAHDERKTYCMYDIGCLCQLGVTKDKMRLMVTKVPSDRGRTNWNQGCAVVNVVEGKIPVFSVDLIHIQNGQALYRGELFQSRPSTI